MVNPTVSYRWNINDNEVLTLYLLVLSADNICKQFVSRPGPTKCRASSGFKLFDTLIVFMKEFFEKVDFEKAKS